MKEEIKLIKSGENKIMKSREQISKIIQENSNKCQGWNHGLTEEESCYTVCNQTMKQNEHGTWFETWNDKDIELKYPTWEEHFNREYLGKVWDEETKDWQYKEDIKTPVKETKHNSRVIQIDCPYKGKHKYELSPIELKDYERIKKSIQRASKKDTVNIYVRIATKYNYTWDDKGNKLVNLVRYEPCSSWTYGKRAIRVWNTYYVDSKNTQAISALDPLEWKLLEVGKWEKDSNGNNKFVHVSGENYYEFSIKGIKEEEQDDLDSEEDEE